MNDMEELQKTAKSDLDQLSRVSHKLAMTESNQLEKVLNLLLPRLLNRIGMNNQKTIDISTMMMNNNSETIDQGRREVMVLIKTLYERIHSKLVEMLSHIIKRVRADGTCKLPCEAILLLLYDKSTSKAKLLKEMDPFTVNLSLTFLTIGVPRNSTIEKEMLLPGLLILLGTHTTIENMSFPSRKNQIFQIAHLILRCIEGIVIDNRKGRKHGLTRPSSTSLSGSKRQASPDDDNNIVVVDAQDNNDNGLEEARKLCSSNPEISIAIYDLLLDVLLYQTTAVENTLPPPGLSTFGKERLCSGSSTIENSWSAEYATNGRLKDLKIAVLDFIAPCRQWDLFNISGKSDKLATARAVSLMVVSSGDQHLDVSEKGASYLKAHMDSMRNNNGDSSQGDPQMLNINLLGHPLILTSSFLRLILGEIVSDNILLKYYHTGFQISLGYNPDSTSDNSERAIVMSTKRRMVSEKSTTVMLSFIASRIMDDIPKLFTYFYIESMTEIENLNSCANLVCLIGSLVLAAVNKFIGTGRSLSSSSLTSTVGNVSVSAAKLLHSFCIRLVSFHELCQTYMIEINDQIKVKTSIEDLLAQCFSVSCEIVRVASSSHSSDVTNKVGMETRDSGYLVISSIARCNVSQVGFLFNGGDKSHSDQSLSTKMASMLFGCLINETELLKPRVIAALDSLLAAYSRLVKASTSSSISNDAIQNASESNPWLAVTTLPQHSSVQTHLLQNQISVSQLSKLLQPVLWNSAKPTNPKASRHASAKWACDLLKEIDLIAACHILCFIAGDKDEATAAVAKEGLGVSYQLGSDEIIIATTSSDEIVTPNFTDFVKTLFSNDVDVSEMKPSFWDLSPQGQATALRYGAMCLLGDLYGGDEESLVVYLAHIGETLKTFSQTSGYSRKDKNSIELLDEASVCLSFCFKESSFSRRNALGEESTLSWRDIASLATTVLSSNARRHLSSAIGFLLEDTLIWNCHVDGVVCPKLWSKATNILPMIQLCFDKLNALSTDYFIVSEIHGAAFLGATCIRANRLINANKTGNYDDDEHFEKSGEIVKLLGHGLMHGDDIVGNTCSRAISIAYAYDESDALELHKGLYDASLEVLKHVGEALRRYSNSDNMDSNRTCLLAKASGIVLAATTLRNETKQLTIPSIGSARLTCVEALFAVFGSSAARHDPEIMLDVGEALTLYADAYSPHGSKWSLPTQVKPKEYDESYAKELPPHAQVFYVILEKELRSNNPHKRNACAPVLLSFVAHAARNLHRDASYFKRVFSEEINKLLIEIQIAFLSLLSDSKSKQLTRESCCIGLAACHGFSVVVSKYFSAYQSVETRVLNERLLRAFGESRNHGGSAFMETRNQHAQRMRQNANGNQEAVSMTEDFGIETEVGGAVGMGEAALGAYREMANAAVTMDRPDILYSLMLLSVSLPIWSTRASRNRFSASSIMGINEGRSKTMNEMKIALQPHMKTLVPRLLRACKDPNKQTREQMEALWIGITGGGSYAREIINSHLLITIDTLMDDALNKLWRARVGACAALAEVIVGRTWENLGGGGPISLDDYKDCQNQNAASRLLRLHNVTVRALDDVRLTVRESGELLSRSVRSLTIRLCDSALMNIDKPTSKRIDESVFSTAATSTILPWLVTHGLNSPCQEAVGFSVSCLLGIVEIATSNTLEPVLPELIGSLLMAMSGLEPAALNYLQTRAAGQDSHRFEQLERIRLQMAQAGPISDAITKCLEIVKMLDSDNQKRAIIPHIDSALRCGAGFATRAAAADAVSTLCSQCPTSFSFSGSSISNPTVRLLRALYFASEREKGSGARDKMIHAFGNLAALAPGKSVRSLAIRLCDRYKQATGSNDDPTARIAAAAALRAIAVRASNQFSDGGSNNVWMRVVLPLAFMGRNDKECESSFREVWDEGGQVANCSESALFAMSLEEKILPHLTKSLIEALNEVSWNRRVIACLSLNELCTKNILTPTPKTGSLDSYSKDDLMQRDLIRSESSLRILRSCLQLILKSRVWDGKSDLVRAIATIASKWTTFSFEDCSQQLNNEKAMLCPILFKHDFDWSELFVGDSWFSQRNNSHSIVLEDGGIEDKMMTSISKLNDEDDSPTSLTERNDLLEEDNDHESENDDYQCDDAEVPMPASISFAGLCRVLLEEGVSPESSKSKFYSNESLHYRAAALDSLSTLLKTKDNIQELDQLYMKMAPLLISTITGYEEIYPCSTAMESFDNIPPLIVARALGCIGSLIWKDMMYDNENIYTDVQLLLQLFSKHCGETQAAWTVREASAIAVSKLAQCSSSSIITNLSFLENIMECSEILLMDKKFYKVRVAKLQILHCLCSRVDYSIEGIKLDENQIVLEALLPLKEKIMKVAKIYLKDAEASVSALSSKIITKMAWWP